MKLFEISTEVSKNQFISTIGSLIPELHAISGSLEKMIDDGHGDIVRRHLRSREARWFSNNFPTILSSANSLKQIDPVFSKIAKIGVTGFTSSSGNSDLTKSNGFKDLMGLVFPALGKVGASALGIKLQQALTKCDRLIAAGAAEQQEAKDFAKPKEPKSDLPGKQFSAIEELINQTIKSLPADLQHQARQVVSKSDNKLKALQAFMVANGR